jgi:hypothetical protein
MGYGKEVIIASESEAIQITDAANEPARWSEVRW